MFRYFDFYGRNVKDLTLLMIVCFDVFESCAAPAALLDLMHFYVIRLFNRFQCVTNMPSPAHRSFCCPVFSGFWCGVSF